MMMETPASAGAQDSSVFKVPYVTCLFSRDVVTVVLLQYDLVRDWQDMDVEAIRRAGFDSIRVFDGEAANSQVWRSERDGALLLMLLTGFTCHLPSLSSPAEVCAMIDMIALFLLSCSWSCPVDCGKIGRLLRSF